MRRRDFIAGLGGAAAMPLVARAQERPRRVGVLNTIPANDQHGQERLGAFLQALSKLGWNIGGNLRVEQRWWAGEAGGLRKLAAELIAANPDVLVATGGLAISPMLEITRSVPIVFVNAPDPVGAGYVDSLARPGGNVTGFTQFEYSTSIKWLELLKQIAPGVVRVGVLRDPTSPSGIGQFGAIQGAAATFGVELIPIGLRDVAELERAIGALAKSPSAGLLVTSGGLTSIHRELIASLAARHKLPAVYPADFFVKSGGLISYGPDRVDMYRQAAQYVDRILKGEKPADLPVQAPTRFEMVINLKTAKALGIAVPPTLLAHADEVIE